LWFTSRCSAYTHARPFVQATRLTRSRALGGGMTRAGPVSRTGLAPTGENSFDLRGLACIAQTRQDPYVDGPWQVNLAVQQASRHMDANSLQPGAPKRSSLFDAARRARASICRGAPRPDTTRKPRRAERGNGAARQRGGSAATRRPARFCGRDEHGEHPPVAPFEHRGTCPVSSWHRRSLHDAASSRARPAADDCGAQAVLVSDMVRRSQRPRLAQCADLR
jgi:hypothetical protein